MIFDLFTELWSTTNGHWTYHHLPPGHFVPYWVPIAWGIAGVLLHRMEKLFFLEYTTALSRFLSAIFLRIFFPILGESIAILNGVWTYHWPYQILGVPIICLLLISYAHLTFSLIRAGLESWLKPTLKSK